MTDTIREQFEAWFATTPDYLPHSLKRIAVEPETYKLLTVQCAWEGFQAAMSSRMVVTEEMVEAGARAVFADPLIDGSGLSWPDFSQAEHYGDCSLAESQAPITCSRCVAEDCRRVSRAALTAALGIDKEG